MAVDYNEVAVGIDLGRETSVMTFYHKNNTEPMTVSSVPGEEKFRFPTPRDLFPLVEQKAELGVALLSNFLKVCFEKLHHLGPLEGRLSVMVTMEDMRPVWADAVRRAMEMLDIPRERVYVQDHLESFYYYALSQKKELRRYKMALFEYKGDMITGYSLSVDEKVKPHLVTIRKGGRISLDAKARGNRRPEHWRRMKDVRFLEQARKLMGTEAYSSVYLVGDGFDRSWEKDSLSYLCTRRKVYQGDNLFSKGACYGAMHLSGIQTIGDYLYQGPDMMEYNFYMQALSKGIPVREDMVTAGISYYMAYYQGELLLEDTDELVFYSRSLAGVEAEHTVSMTGLPKRPSRGTRIRLELTFPAKDICRVKLEDLGMGELYPSSGKKWKADIRLQ